MTEVTNELVYEGLKAIQADVSTIKIEVRETKDEMRAMRDHLNATNRDIANIYATLDRHDGSLSRISRRLELDDATH